MADLSQVSDSLKDVILSAFYPNGITNPSIVPSVTGITVYVGWPFPADLERDLAQNIVHVTIWPLPTSRNTTRFREEWEPDTINLATITLTVTNNTVTVGGVVTTNGQTCMVIVNKIGYAYTVQTGDTLDTIANALAGLIPTATAIGNVITIPAAHSLIARVTVSGNSVLEFKRQQQMYQVSVWAASFAARAACAPIIDQTLGFIKRFVIPDNFWAPIVHMHTKEFDMYEKTPVYRRDLIYQVEYPTTITKTYYTITDPVATVSIYQDI